MDKKVINIDQSFANNLLNQFTQLWITPEIYRRKEEGMLSHNFSLEKAQVLFCLGSPPIIRLNEEVKIKVKVKVNRSIKKGEPVYAKDISGVAEIKNIDEENDFRYVILIKIGTQTYIAFNFEHDVSKSKKLLEIGTSFLTSARTEFEKGNVRQMVELLLIAAENLVKSRFYLLPDQKIRKIRTHKGTQHLINLYAKDGKIIKAEQKDVFNRLTALRDSARYELDFAFKKDEAEKSVIVIEAFAREINELLR